MLRDNVVLDPVWLIDGLKTVITAEKFAIRTPMLDKQWKAFCESGVISRSAIGMLLLFCVTLLKCIAYKYKS